MTRNRKTDPLTATALLLTAMLAMAPLVARAAEDAAAGDAAAETRPAAELTVDQIVHNTNAVSYYQGDTGRAKVKMAIHDAQGRTRNREFTILRWDQRDPNAPEDDAEADKPAAKGDGEAKAKKPAPEKPADVHTGEQKFYVYFEAPSDVKRTVFLVWKHLDKDDDRWLYVPALDLVKRISAADKRTSFVGSHFYYEDVSGRNVDLDKHERVEGETNDTYYVLKNTPKDPDTVEFAYYKMWIHRESFVVVQTKYYDEEGKNYRTYRAKKVDTIDGYPTVTVSEMHDHRGGGHTVLTYDDVQYNVGLTEEIFSQRYLRRPPRKYLK